MAKYITEVLKEINDNPDLLLTTYKKQGDGGPLLKFFHHAFVPRYKFLLPAGTPPYKPSPEPIGMTPSNMMAEIRMFYTLCDTNVRSFKREEIFIRMLENLHPDEAKILIAVKDQTLTKLYPNITVKAVADAGFISQPPPEVLAKLMAENAVEASESPTPTVKKKGRPPKTKSSEGH